MKPSVLELKRRKGGRMVMLTAYDYPTARLAVAGGVDVLLVGDSVGMVALGYDSTVPVTMDEMIHHTKAARRGAPETFLVADLPFLSFATIERALANSERFLKEAGADAVKLEGGSEVAPIAQALVRAGVPVLGHVGLTPQTASALGGFKLPARGARESLGVALGGTAAVLDLRPATEFAKGHIPGTINIPLNKSFNTWAGWLVRYDQPIHLIVDEADAPKAVRELAMIGLDHVAAWYAPSIVGEWEKAGQALGTVRKTDVAQLAPKLAAGSVTVLDVRNRSEYEAGHLPGSLHIPVGYLAERLAEIPRDKPIVVQCQSGARSAIATSVLQRLGVTDATDLVGGFVAWANAGKEVVVESATAGV